MQSSAADRDYEVEDLRCEAGASGSAEVGAAHVAWQPSTRGRATASCWRSSMTD
jgi:hypothetical protein